MGGFFLDTAKKINEEHYNNSSTAYEFDRQQRTKKRQENELKKTNQIIRPINKAKLFKYVVSSIFVFCGCLVFVVFYSRVTFEQASLSKLQKQYKEIQDQNAILKAELDDSFDIKKVEEIAKTKLGMAKPEKYQVRYINVPKQSYTIQKEPVEQKDNPTFSLSSIKNLVVPFFKKEK